MKRKAIRKDDYFAAALACLLPQAKRDELRAAKVPAQTVIRLFSPDHIHLHSLGGSDQWWNLDPRLRPAHAEKSKRDTSIAAKVKRLLGETCTGPKRPIPQRANPWPPRGSRKILSRSQLTRS